MTPPTVQYTGLELNPRDMIWSRVVDGPFPASWQRIVMPLADFNTRPLTTWTLENTNGRFGVIHQYPTAVLYFEDTNDAILFKLRDGPEAWREAQTTTF